MALENQSRTVWLGEDVVIPYGPIQDGDGNNIDFSGSTITWRLTTKPGGGETVVSKTTGGGITLLAGDETFEVSIADTDLSGQIARVYYHEVQATLSSGSNVQIQAPSRFHLRPSAIKS